MRHEGTATRLIRIGLVLGLSTATLLGQTLPALAGPRGGPRLTPTPAEAPSTGGAILAPQAAVAWTIDSQDGPRPRPVMSGDGFVGPNGTLVVGPYGAVPVAGLTLTQAQAAIERHLARHVKNPKVHVTLTAAGGPSLGEMPTPQVMTHSEPPLQPQQAMLSAVPPTWKASPGREPVAALGAPAPFESAAPPRADWQPVQRPVETISAVPATSQWRPVPRPGAPTSVVAAGFQAPMPVGPALDGATPPATTAPEPAEDLRNIPPRPVPTTAQTPLAADGGPVEGGPVGPPPAPTECNKTSLPSYVIDPPDILIVESTQQLRDQPVRGQHLVRPDGTIGLGIYGSVHVAGMTLEMAKEAIAVKLGERIAKIDRRNLYVDVLAYNSKFYYVITDGGGYGEQVIRFPITGSETVLDAISQINGLPAVASKKDIWVARAAPCRDGHGSGQVLPVDWCAVSRNAYTQTNYQLMPGDRIYVKAQRIIRIDSTIAKIVSPIERLLGVTLLGASTVNTIKNRNGQ